MVQVGWISPSHPLAHLKVQNTNGLITPSHHPKVHDTVRVHIHFKNEQKRVGNKVQNQVCQYPFHCSLESTLDAE